MFHWATGIPFHNELHSGAYDELTLWEQIDEGAQYTPAKKWLFCMPISLCVSVVNSEMYFLTILMTYSFLLSTHYTHYNPWLFAINLTALIFVLLPKLPMVRLLIQYYISHVYHRCFSSIVNDYALCLLRMVRAYLHRSPQTSHRTGLVRRPTLLRLPP